MDTSTYRQTKSAVPAPDAGDKDKSLLLVLLAEFDFIEDKLIDHLQPPDSSYKIQKWKPSRSLLRSLAPQRPRRDSLAVLYGLAIIAHRAGRSNFIVADEATKQRVKGEFVVRGEDDEISVVLISVRPKKEAGHVRVLAKRTTMKANPDDDDEDYEKVDLSSAVESFEVSSDFEKGEEEDGYPKIYDNLGFELLDPESTPFTPGTVDYFGYERISKTAMNALSENTPLPAELVLDILSRAEKDLGNPIELPAGLDIQATSPVINIMLCFKATKDERERLRSFLQGAVHAHYEKLASEPLEDHSRDESVPRTRNRTGGRVDLGGGRVLLAGPAESNEVEEEFWTAKKLSMPKENRDIEPTVRLIEWDKARVPSRRDIANLRERTDYPRNFNDRGTVFKLPYFLVKPIEGDDDVSSCKLLSVYDCEAGLATFWMPLNDIVLQKQGHQETWDILQRSKSKELELLPSPYLMASFDKPFYPNPHPGNPVGRRTNSIGLWFLTNKLNDEQIEAIYREVLSLGAIDDEDREKVICPVPWKEGEEDADDGTAEDMWRIYKEVDGKCEWPLVFIDQQSAVDLKVLMSEPEHVYTADNKEAEDLLKNLEQSHYRGVRYGRLEGREAHIAWMNLNIANMGFDELVEEDGTELWLRPDWPYHHMVTEFGEWQGI